MQLISTTNALSVIHLMLANRSAHVEGSSVCGVGGLLPYAIMCQHVKGIVNGCLCTERHAEQRGVPGGSLHDVWLHGYWSEFRSARSNLLPLWCACVALSSGRPGPALAAT